MLSFGILPFLGVGLLGLQVSAAPVSSPTEDTSAPCIRDTTNAPALPVNGGGTELPASTLTLKYITIGHGVQNYSCAAPSAVPVATGALATLYDVDSLRNNPNAINGVPPNEVYTPLPSPNSAILTTSGSGYLAGVGGTYRIIGHHFFGADGTPIFNLSTVGDILFGKKTADIKAPANASRGVCGTGAVDWLQLSDKGGSVGVTQVYRVVTAGGAAPKTCQGEGTNGLGVGTVSVPYAAEYWFYG